MVAENISELNNLDISTEALGEGYGESIGIASVISVSSEMADADAGADTGELSESSIDGEEYVIL
jgi:hypothetical protein